MKVRNGFVSNSSSSSFILAYKDRKELRKNLEQAFKLPHDFPIKLPSDSFSNVLFNRCAEEFKSLDDYIDWCNNEGNDEGNDVDKYVANLLKQDYQVSIGSVCDEDESVEAILCDSDIHYHTDELIIEKGGGY